MCQGLSCMVYLVDGYSYMKVGMERVLELRCLDIGTIRMRFANKDCLSDAYRIVSAYVLE